MVDILIAKKVYDELVKIAKEEKPNEACAYLFKDNTIVVKGEPDIKTPGYFEVIDNTILIKSLEDYGIPSALFHSHPCEATPSYTDVRFMIGTTLAWGCPWLIMSDKYRLRCWNLKDFKYPEEEEVKII